MSVSGAGGSMKSKCTCGSEMGGGECEEQGNGIGPKSTQRLKHEVSV